VSELAFSTSGLAENVLAGVAGDDSLGMTENDAGSVTATALNIHEIRVRHLNESLQLVRLFLFLVTGLKKVMLHVEILFY
jgi:hypothetical protein